MAQPSQKTGDGPTGAGSAAGVAGEGHAGAGAGGRDDRSDDPRGGSSGAGINPSRIEAAAPTVPETVPEIVLLFCQNTVGESEIAAAARGAEGFTVRPVMLPCSSKVQAHQLLQILDQGADGIEVVACPEKMCRFLVGSRRAGKRIEYARGLLDAVGVGGQRIGISWMSRLTVDELMERAADRAREVAALTGRGDGK